MRNVGAIQQITDANTKRFIALMGIAELLFCEPPRNGLGPGGYDVGQAKSTGREAALFDYDDWNHRNHSARMGKWVALVPIRAT